MNTNASATNTAVTHHPALRIPQARVLTALMPRRPELPNTEWPLLTKANLLFCAGYTPISGIATRALNGIKRTGKSGTAHKGLIDLGYVEVLPLSIEGVSENNYRITQAGIEALMAFRLAGGALPKVCDPESRTNHRYMKEE